MYSMVLNEKEKGDNKKRDIVYDEFMLKLESTTQNLTKSFAGLGAENKELAFSYVEKEVSEELKNKKK